MNLLKRPLKILGLILFGLLFLIGVLTISSIRWAIRLFGGISVEEIVFHLKVPLNGTDSNTIVEFIMFCLLPSLLLTALFVLGLLWCRPNRQKRLEMRAEKQMQLNGSKWVKAVTVVPFYIPKPVFALVAFCVFGGGMLYANAELDVAGYLKNQNQRSTLIEEEYVEPRSVNLTFPEKKRNLIFIFLESMESSFSSKEKGGAFSEDLIPELVAMAEENIHFTDKASGLGGETQMPGTSWTIAGMFARTAGLPLRVPIDGNDMSSYASFFPGVYSIGEILQEHGYRNYLMIGSEAVFGGRKNYFTQHGNYEIFDYYTAVDEKKIPRDYFRFWGFEDKKLFAYAKEKLLELAREGKPFNFTLLTVDTHFPDGYQCELCEAQFDTSYKNALACSSRQIAEFVNWIRQQDFYENTTIVLTGDHTTMAQDFSAEMPQDYQRHIYNAFINSAAEPQKTNERTFSAFDLYPTTLAAMGVKIDGERLAIGTNLFSDKPTLLEEKGVSLVAEELVKKSDFYNSRLMYGETEKE